MQAGPKNSTLAAQNLKFTALVGLSGERKIKALAYETSLP